MVRYVLNLNILKKSKVLIMPFLHNKMKMYKICKFLDILIIIPNFKGNDVLIMRYVFNNF